MTWTMASGPGLYQQPGFDEMIRADVRKAMDAFTPELRDTAQRALDTPGPDGARQCHGLLQAAGLWNSERHESHAGALQ